MTCDITLARLAGAPGGSVTVHPHVIRSTLASDHTVREFQVRQTEGGIDVAWIGAGVSKLTHNFPFAVQAMISNAPLRPKAMKRALYRQFPTDMRPSGFAWALAHVGTLFELGGSAALLSLHGTALNVVVALMVIFHLHIISAIPLGVPNEWNVFMIYATLVLFWAHGDVGPVTRRA